MANKTTWKTWDAPILVAVSGLLVTKPEIANSIHDWLVKVVPVSWNWLGAWTLPILGVAAGLLIGFIADKTSDQ